MLSELFVAFCWIGLCMLSIWWYWDDDEDANKSRARVNNAMDEICRDNNKSPATIAKETRLDKRLVEDLKRELKRQKGKRIVEQIKCLKGFEFDLDIGGYVVVMDGKPIQIQYLSEVNVYVKGKKGYAVFAEFELFNIARVVSAYKQ